eukprot:6461275-Ditylum_brightwellii.AAC.1
MMQRGKHKLQTQRKCKHHKVVTKMQKCQGNDNMSIEELYALNKKLNRKLKKCKKKCKRSYKSDSLDDNSDSS